MNEESLVSASTTVDATSSLEKSEVATRSSDTKVGLDAFDWKLRLIYICGFLFFFLTAMTIIPLVAKINLVKTGDAEDTSSAASFVAFTSFLLKNLTEFLTVKYNSAFSDYCGRKSILLLAATAQGVSAFILAGSNTDGMFYVAAIVGGTFQSYNVIIAWICDLIKVEDRGKALGASVGISVGLGFAMGIPLSSAISQDSGPDLPLYISAIGCIFLFAYIVFIPVNDVQSSLLKSTTEETVAAISSPLHEDSEMRASVDISKGAQDQRISVSTKKTCYQTFMADRRLPSNWSKFMAKNHPLTGISLVKQAKHVEDWMSFFFSYISQQVAFDKTKTFPYYLY